MISCGSGWRSTQLWTSSLFLLSSYLSTWTGAGWVRTNLFLLLHFSPFLYNDSEQWESYLYGQILYLENLMSWQLLVAIYWTFFAQRPPQVQPGKHTMAWIVSWLTFLSRLCSSSVVTQSLALTRYTGWWKRLKLVSVIISRSLRSHYIIL